MNFIPKFYQLQALSLYLSRIDIFSSYNIIFGSPYLFRYNMWRLIRPICFVVLEIFHKFDGFVYPERSTISWDRLFSSGSPINDRQAFFQFFFPKWSGFYVDSFDENIQPVEALQNLACLVESTSVVWTSTSGVLHRHTVDSNNKLKLGEVGAKIYLLNQIGQFMPKLPISVSSAWKAYSNCIEIQVTLPRYD